MNQKQIRAAVEAMLFACGEPIGSDKLAQAVQLPQTSVENALEELRTRYTREDSGLCLLHLNTRWQLATKTEWADCIRRLLDSRRAVPLGPAAMETLTVKAGALGITFPVFQYPKPEPTEESKRKKKPKKAKAAKKPAKEKKPAEPRKKA